MPVLLHLTDARIEQVASRIDQMRPFTVSVPKNSLVLPSQAWRLCLILANNPLVWDVSGERVVADSKPIRRHVVAFARIRGSGRYSTTDDRVMLADSAWIEDAVLVDDLVRAVPPAMRREAREALRRPTAELHSAVAGELVEVLVRLRPDIAMAVQRLRRRVTEVPAVDGPEGGILALERDAVHLALSVAGIDTESLTDWEGTRTARGFLPSLAYDTHEDVLLAHDASRFPNYTALPSERPDWLLFGDGRHHIRIGSVNHTKLESTLGVDLIYRHIEADTFVLVQYKRMEKAGDGWFHRPDRQLYDQLTMSRSS